MTRPSRAGRPAAPASPVPAALPALAAPLALAALLVLAAGAGYTAAGAGPSAARWLAPPAATAEAQSAEAQSPEARSPDAHSPEDRPTAGARPTGGTPPAAGAGSTADAGPAAGTRSGSARTEPLRLARPQGAGPAGAAGGAAPDRLRIGTLGVDTPLEALRVGPAGELGTPRDFARAGWFADGTAPGDVGPAVIAGHVDSYRGPAVFHRLAELGPGDTVEVRRGGVWTTFRVARTARYAKDRFPTGLVYGPTPDPQLRLITCGGDFDRRLRSYGDNVVVYAVAD